jgi:signal peptidase
MYIGDGQQDRVRHRGDKAFLVGSVMSVWFVLYFMSGIITSYVHNSLVSSPKSILVNIWAFGAVAFAIEYSRHGLMLMVRRRHVVWFGLIVALVLGIQQMNFGLIPLTHGLDSFVKLAISDFVPALLSSLLLTYLAITAGLPSMLVYRLGLVAATILPPIVPKYDWYMQGVSLILLAVSIYISMDRTRQDREAPTRHRYHHHPRRAYDMMAVLIILGMAMFMTGLFSYKPAAIASNSMQPVFSRGAMVIVRKAKPVDVRVGDIVQYRRESITVTHRVVEIDNAADGSGKKVFVTKGDNNHDKDPLVSQSQIIGIVRAKIPLIGYPSVWLLQVSGHYDKDHP